MAEDLDGPIEPDEVCVDCLAEVTHTRECRICGDLMCDSCFYDNGQVCVHCRGEEDAE